MFQANLEAVIKFQPVSLNSLAKLCDTFNKQIPLYSPKETEIVYFFMFIYPLKMSGFYVGTLCSCFPVPIDQHGGLS